MEARQAHLERRKNHSYTSMPIKLAAVIDTIVDTVFHGGDKKYQDRKDFVIKSIQNQVEFETKRNPELKQKLLSLPETKTEITVRRRGNRIHDTTFRIK